VTGFGSRLAWVLCVVAGGLLCLSLPPFGLWPLAVRGLVLVDRLVAERSVRWPRWRPPASRL